ncbi:SAM-dependent methyltransferase [Mycetocola sp. CAN_C7]|uniref:methyltransferase domain-containing protein n=1 Tax=Mycetocola sp. CAN_C7 TaxID=2787724 RepID=UPI0018CBBDA5
MNDGASGTDGGTRYSHGHEPAVLASHGARTAANSAAYLIPHLSPGMSILDVGCGPGSITLDLADLVTPGLVVGLEKAEAPLVAARTAAAARGDQTTRFELGDVMALPYADDTFDVVHAHQVLQHLTDPVGALQEMVRVCRPGGWIAARDADYDAMAWHPELPELDDWRTLYRAIARGNGAEPDAGRRMRAWANAAGVPDATITSSVWTYATAAECMWWGNGQADRVAGEMFVRQAVEQGIDSVGVQAIAGGWRAWGQDPDAWFLIPHGEILAHLPAD